MNKITHLFVNEHSVLKELIKLQSSVVTSSEKFLIAFDEVGRGCGAGPVVVCMSLWTCDQSARGFSSIRSQQLSFLLSFVNDSKKIKKTTRQEIYEQAARFFNFENLQQFNDYLVHHSEKNISITVSDLKKPENFLKIKGLSDNLEHFDSTLSLMCLNASLGLATPAEIDSYNIWNGTQLAAARALQSFEASLHLDNRAANTQGMADEANGGFLNRHNTVILVDGNLTLKVPESFMCFPQVVVPKADSLFKTVGFSSILAKVYRDNLMKELALDYPDYLFEENKGYLTGKHIEMLKKNGPTPIHRRSFINHMLT